MLGLTYRGGPGWLNDIWDQSSHVAVKATHLLTHPSAVCYSPRTFHLGYRRSQTLRGFYPTHNAHKLLALFFLPVIRLQAEYINRDRNRRYFIAGSKICRNAVRRRKKIGININIAITIKQEYGTLLHEFTNEL